MQDHLRVTCNSIHISSGVQGHRSSHVKAAEIYGFLPNRYSLIELNMVLFQWVRIKLSLGLWPGKFATVCSLGTLLQGTELIDHEYRTLKEQCF